MLGLTACGGSEDDYYGAGKSSSGDTAEVTDEAKEWIRETQTKQRHLDDQCKQACLDTAMEQHPIVDAWNCDYLCIEHPEDPSNCDGSCMYETIGREELAYTQQITAYMQCILLCGL